MGHEVKICPKCRTEMVQVFDHDEKKTKGWCCINLQCLFFDKAIGREKSLPLEIKPID